MPKKKFNQEWEVPMAEISGRLENVEKTLIRVEHKMDKYIESSEARFVTKEISQKNHDHTQTLILQEQAQHVVMKREQDEILKVINTLNVRVGELEVKVQGNTADTSWLKNEVVKLLIQTAVIGAAVFGVVKLT